MVFSQIVTIKNTHPWNELEYFYKNEAERYKDPQRIEKFIKKRRDEFNQDYEKAYGLLTPHLQVEEVKENVSPPLNGKLVVYPQANILKVNSFFLLLYDHLVSAFKLANEESPLNLEFSHFLEEVSKIRYNKQGDVKHLRHFFKELHVLLVNSSYFGQNVPFQEFINGPFWEKIEKAFQLKDIPDCFLGKILIKPPRGGIDSKLHDYGVSKMPLAGVFSNIRHLIKYSLRHIESAKSIVIRGHYDKIVELNLDNPMLEIEEEKIRFGSFFKVLNLILNRLDEKTTSTLTSENIAEIKKLTNNLRVLLNEKKPTLFFRFTTILEMMEKFTKKYSHHDSGKLIKEYPRSTLVSYFSEAHVKQFAIDSDLTLGDFRKYIQAAEIMQDHTDQCETLIFVTLADLYLCVDLFLEEFERLTPASRAIIGEWVQKNTPILPFYIPMEHPVQEESSSKTLSEEIGSLTLSIRRKTRKNRKVSPAPLPINISEILERTRASLPPLLEHPEHRTPALTNMIVNFADLEALSTMNATTRLKCITCWDRCYYFLEQTFRYQIIEKTAVDSTFHNLRSLAHVLQQEGKVDFSTPVVQKLFAGHLWTRHTSEQYTKWTSFGTEAPYILQGCKAINRPDFSSDYENDLLPLMNEVLTEVNPLLPSPNFETYLEEAKYISPKTLAPKPLQALKEQAASLIQKQVPNETLFHLFSDFQKDLILIEELETRLGEPFNSKEFPLLLRYTAKLHHSLLERLLRSLHFIHFKEESLSHDIDEFLNAIRLKNPFPSPLKEEITLYFNDLHRLSNYPFDAAKIKSPWHRALLQAHIIRALPAILEGFQLVQPLIQFNNLEVPTKDISLESIYTILLKSREIVYKSLEHLLGEFK